MSSRSLRKQVTCRRSSKLSYTYSPPCRTPSFKRSLKQSKSIKNLKRSSSEPILLIPHSYDHLDSKSDGFLVNLQNQTSHVFASSPKLLTGSPQTLEGYCKDAKVVITVTVEGSPGPILVMIKLGSSVEDIINTVLNKYRREGRTPKLEGNASAFELHPSYFSVECLDKSKLLGDIGSRTFYLRRGNNSNCAGHEVLHVEIDSTRAGAPPPMLPPPLFAVANLFMAKFAKLDRRLRKLWRFLVCQQ